MREERRGRRRNRGKVRERRETGEEVSGMQRISPKVKSVKRRGAGRAGEDVTNGM